MLSVKDVDLNLLVAFDAMMRERNVTRAGLLLGLTQPAMSQALAKLRSLWGDPLFVRAGAAMEPTPFALLSAPAVAEGLAALHRGLNCARAFDPLTSDRLFNLIMGDIGETVYLPRICGALRQQAPRVNLRVMVLPREAYREALASGHADLAIGVLPGLTNGYYQQKLLEDRYVCLVSARHPRIRDGLTIQQFCEEGHALVEPGGSQYNEAVSQSSTTTILERHLAAQGIVRRIAVRVPHFTSVPGVVALTDLIGTVPGSVLGAVQGAADVRVLPVPVETPSFMSNQYWHERNHMDAANQWLRGLIAGLFTGKQAAS